MVTDPVQILDNMRTIVENEMLCHLEYITPHIVNPELADQGAICGGHRACAVGSLWLAAGVRPEGEAAGRYLPGVDFQERHSFMLDKPALRAAYDALCDAAGRYTNKHGIDLGDAFEMHGKLEQLFETGRRHGLDVDKTVMFEVIADARAHLSA